MKACYTGWRRGYVKVEAAMLYHRVLRNLCATLYNVVHLGAAIAQSDVVYRHLHGEVKVKVTLEQAAKAQKGSRYIALSSTSALGGSV
jgi:hypothetical protein